LATQVFKTEAFTLQDESEVEVKPLTINRLRKFMAVITKMNDIEDEADAVDVLFDAAVIAIAKNRPDLAEDREKLEDILDMPTLHKILEVAGGVKLNDPNPTAAGLVGTT